MMTRLANCKCCQQVVDLVMTLLPPHCPLVMPMLPSPFLLELLPPTILRLLPPPKQRREPTGTLPVYPCLDSAPVVHERVHRTPLQVLDHDVNKLAGGHVRADLGEHPALGATVVALDRVFDAGSEGMVRVLLVCCSYVACRANSPLGPILLVRNIRRVINKVPSSLRPPPMIPPIALHILPVHTETRVVFANDLERRVHYRVRGQFGRHELEGDEPCARAGEGEEGEVSHEVGAGDDLLSRGKDLGGDGVRGAGVVDGIGLGTL